MTEEVKCGGGQNFTDCPTCGQPTLMVSGYQECRCPKCQKHKKQTCSICQTEFIPAAVEFWKKLRKEEQARANQTLMERMKKEKKKE